MDINAGSMSSRGSVQYVRSRSSTPLSRGSSSALSRAESESYEGEEVDLPPEDMPEQGIPPSGRSRRTPRCDRTGPPRRWCRRSRTDQQEEPAYYAGDAQDGAGL